MSEAVPTYEPKLGVTEVKGADAGVSVPALRMVGYCADCGTWDEHGPTCIACGYNFSGSETPLSPD